MRGLMMDQPLLISSLLDYAAAYYGGQEVVSVTADNPRHRTTYGEVSRRAKQMAGALRNRLGIETGDRIATLAWNDHRHLELYYAISGMGAVCHTVNPRLFPDQIVYILNHAADRVLFIDPMFLPLLEKIRPALKCLEAVVVMTAPSHMPKDPPDGLHCYESLIADQPDDLVWPVFEETLASSLCYTSGTTGNPKGVLYHHRSTVLHALTVSLANHLAITSGDVVLPVVPMFHVNAWGLPYMAPMSGAKMVMPGPRLDGAGLLELIQEEKVTVTAGVPTLWAGLLAHCDQVGARLATLRLIVIGGAAAPLSMIERFENEHGVEVGHGWGMTEMSPVGTVCRTTAENAGLPVAERQRLKLKQGRPLWGVEVKIVDEQGRHLPHDGKTSGLLLVRGPWITSGYYEDDEANVEAFDGEGWFRTGDIVTIDPDGLVQVTDRAKDVIKSGGEWISSIDLEHAAVGHPALVEAAVIGIPDEKWGERPLLIAVRKEGETVEKTEILGFLEDKVAGWWLPEDVIFVDKLPHTATGKILKTALRERYGDHRPEAG
jgi:fatty-acyl-CoA synthase